MRGIVARTASAERAELPFGGFVVDVDLLLTVVVVFFAAGAPDESACVTVTKPSDTTIAIAGNTTMARLDARDLDDMIIVYYTRAGTPAVPSSPNHLSPHSARSPKVGTSSLAESVRWYS